MKHTKPTTSRTARSREQGGYVLPMFAILLTALMALAGFGVDVWNWWYTAQKVQRAADAGSLAGVVFMPGDINTARTTAVNVVSGNGYPAAQVTAVQGDRPNRLRVEVTQQVDNSFVSLLGVRTTNVTRDATAEFSGVVETGSPINQMGNQPGSSDWPGSTTTDVEATNPQVWAQIAGFGNSKENGDRYGAGGCSSGNFQCNTASSPSNLEYNSSGYYYTIRVNATAADLNRFLLVEVYDPAFVHSGDTCNNFSSGTGANEGTITSGLAGLGVAAWNPANNAEYCSGDNISTGSIPGSDNAARLANYAVHFPTVMYRTAGPDATPWNVQDNFSTNPIASCDGSQVAVGGSTTPASRFRPYGESPNTSETPANLPTQLATSGSYASRVYHRYVRVCAVRLSSIGITSAGEYDLSFNTDVVQNTSRTGHNRYAIRAGLADSATATSANGSQVSVFANGPMPLYQNVAGSTAAFYLARVLPGSANRILNVEFFDVGDGGGTGSITIVPPADSNVGANFSSPVCTATSSATSQPTVNTGTCTLTGVSSGSTYQAQRVQMRVPIPNNYTCGHLDGAGNRVIGATECWVRVRFNWSQDIADTTTWRATILGDPVRLTE